MLEGITPPAPLGTDGFTLGSVLYDARAAGPVGGTNVDGYAAGEDVVGYDVEG